MNIGDDDTPKFGTPEYYERLGAHPMPDVGEHARNFFYSVSEYEVQYFRDEIKLRTGEVHGTTETDWIE